MTKSEDEAINQLNELFGTDKTEIQSKKTIDKFWNRISNELDVEVGQKNPFTPRLLDIANGTRKSEELDESDFIKYTDKVKKSRKKYYLGED